MSLYDFLHDFFGNSHESKGRPPEFESNSNFWFNNPNGLGNSNTSEDDDIKYFSSIFDLKMNDPFEMHRLFEQKINEMMKSFMSPEGLTGFQSFGFETPDVPSITEKDPREHYLKPGPRKPSTPGEKSEDESSGATTPWLDKLIPTPDQERKPMQPQIFSSFKSVIRKTVRLPDGTVKTEEIIQNADGTEERTESHSKFDGTNTPFSSPFGGPDFSGLFSSPKVPVLKEPRYQCLKPGYEKFDPYGKKVDKDLDKQIEESGIESLPPFTKEPEFTNPNTNLSVKSFTRRSVTLPNGVVESEEIIHSPDGTEQRTVTHTTPDGSTKTVTGTPTDSWVAGQNKDILIEGYDKPVLSFALRGVKDFLDILFK